MWLLTLFVMILQFVIIGGVLAIVFYALIDWLNRDDEPTNYGTSP